MDSNRFDSLAKTIGRRRSRRSAFQALAATALTAASVRLGLSEEPAAAAQVTTERRFDCLAVGDSCNGKDDKCCSGRCEGKKGKKGGRARTANGERTETTRASASLMTKAGALARRTRTPVPRGSGLPAAGERTADACGPLAMRDSAVRSKGDRLPPASRARCVIRTRTATPWVTGPMRPASFACLAVNSRTAKPPPV